MTFSELGALSPIHFTAVAVETLRGAPTGNAWRLPLARTLLAALNTSLLTPLHAVCYVSGACCLRSKHPVKYCTYFSAIVMDIESALIHVL